MSSCFDVDSTFSGMEKSDKVLLHKRLDILHLYMHSRKNDEARHSNAMNVRICVCMQVLICVHI